MSASTDISKLLAGLKQYEERVRSAALLATNQAGEHILGDAMQLCPVKVGNLQASGTTEPAKIDGNVLTKVIGFNTSYAAAVHENLQANHAYPGAKNPNAQAKYLETAMREKSPAATEYIASRVKAAM